MTRHDMQRRVSVDQLRRGQENQAAIREQHEQDQIRAMWRQQQMSNRDKSPMGITRTDTEAAGRGLSALGELNQRLDEALDEVEKAFKRERLAAQTSGVDDSDARRAPVLGNRQAVQ